MDDSGRDIGLLDPRNPGQCSGGLGEHKDCQRDVCAEFILAQPDGRGGICRVLPRLGIRPANQRLCLHVLAHFDGDKQIRNGCESVQ